MNDKPLNILQVASGMPNFGGSELHLLELSGRLRERGHSVDVLARPGSFVFEEATKRAFTVHPGVVRSQSDFAAFGRLLPVLKANRYDLLHVHMFPDHLVPPAVGRYVGIPVNIMTHHLPHPLRKGILKRFAVPRLFDRAIAVSESVRRTLLGSGLAEDQVVTIHHGTDTNAFREVTVAPEVIRQEWGVPEGHFVVGAVGRVVVEKGLEYFLQALPDLKSLPVHAVLVGDGPELDRMRQIAADLNLENRLTFAGFRSDVNNAMNALDALVLSSTWAEPCAAVVQQAMALGKPVVGTDIGGTPEMIVREKTGLLVAPGDAGAITAAVGRLVANPEEGRRMGEAGRLRADEHFTLSNMVDRIEALYREEGQRCGGR